jgi:pyruvate formate-lyase activating enzyme-like uncharacterized protein
MKIIVDELPEGCRSCMFGKVEIVERYCDYCECKLLDKLGYDDDLQCKRLYNCPLKSIKDYIKEV